MCNDMKHGYDTLTVPDFSGALEQIVFESGTDFEVGNARRACEAEISFYHPDAISLILSDAETRDGEVVEIRDGEATLSSDRYRLCKDYDGSVYGVAVSYDTAREIGRTGLPLCLGGVEGYGSGHSAARSAVLLACLAVQGQFIDGFSDTAQQTMLQLPSPRLSNEI